MFKKFAIRFLEFFIIWIIISLLLPQNPNNFWCVLFGVILGDILIVLTEYCIELRFKRKKAKNE